MYKKTGWLCLSMRYKCDWRIHNKYKYLIGRDVINLLKKNWGKYDITWQLGKNFWPLYYPVIPMLFFKFNLFTFIIIHLLFLYNRL